MLAGALVLASPAPADDLGFEEALGRSAVAERERLLDLALDHFVERTTRIQRISQRLRLAGREICGSYLSPILGVAVVDPDDVPAGLGDHARQRYGPGDGVTVVAVFPGMAGEAAGLSVGDEIVAVDGGLRRSVFSVYRPATLPGDPEVRVDVRRGGEEWTVRVKSRPGCRYPVGLQLAEFVNAWADGSRVAISAALERELPDDAHLAYVIGHELGHNILVKSGFDVMRRGRTRRHMIRTEQRADYLGVYLAAMAGYPLPSDPTVWTTVAGTVSRLRDRASSHPLTQERTLALRKTVEEIEGKRARGEPLVPTER